MKIVAHQIQHRVKHGGTMNTSVVIPRPVRRHFFDLGKVPRPIVLTVIVFACVALGANSACSQFVQTPVPGLPGVVGGSAAWGDYDNDGRLDLLLAGEAGSAPKVMLWRNSGSGFSDVTSVAAPGLPRVFSSSLAWGDFDNDGRLDFLITGLVNFSPTVGISQVWRNTGSGFTNVPIPGLPGVAWGSGAWGDFDNDGQPDFLITGETNGFSNGATSQLWRNTGSGFTNVPMPGLPGTTYGSLAWADYDSDGRLDFLIAGLGVEDAVSQVWRNTGSGFINVPVPNLPGTFDNTLAWGDYDSDGRLDFVIAGWLIEGGVVSQLWRNNVIASNSPPAAPAGLSSVISGTTAVLRWNPPVDDHTPATGLSYNVRIGTTPGGSDIVSAPALPNGALLVASAGAVRGDSTAIHNLTPGRTYYWSVQAVDIGFAGSPFAAEQQFSTSVEEVSIPDPGLNAAIREALQKPNGPLTVPDLLSLTNLDASRRNIKRIDGLEAARNLEVLGLQFNQLTNFSLPSTLTNLQVLDVSVNGMTSFSMSNALPNLAVLVLADNALTNLAVPAGLTGLNSLDLSGNRLTSFEWPSNLTQLVALHLRANLFTNFTLPGVLRGLILLDIGDNLLRDITLLPGMNQLAVLRLANNRLNNLILPPGLTGLLALSLTGNQLTNVALPSDLNRLESLLLSGNQLASLTLPSGLTNLVSCFVVSNQLTSLTLPPDMTQLIVLGFQANPLTTVVLPETLAATTLAGDVAALRNQGVSVFAYPLTLQLILPDRTVDGAFDFTLTGPPGFYTVLSSTNLAAWSALGIATNTLGEVIFADAQATLSPQKFYRALLQSPATNITIGP